MTDLLKELRRLAEASKEIELRSVACSPADMLRLLDALERSMSGMDWVAKHSVVDWGNNCVTPTEAAGVARDTLAEIRRILKGEHG